LRRLVELISRNGMVGESKMPSCLGEVRSGWTLGKLHNCWTLQSLWSWLGSHGKDQSWVYYKLAQWAIGWIWGSWRTHYMDVEVGANPLGKLNPRNWCWAQCCQRNKVHLSQP
jgi:hypothetical protein